MLSPEWRSLPASYRPKSLRMLDRKGHLSRKNDLIRRHLREYESGPQKRVLDLSCGNGVFLEIMRHRGHEIMGVDVQYFEFLESQRVPYVKHDCRVLPYPFDDQSFDLVSCVGSISGYAEDWRDVLPEFFRIARECIFLYANNGEPLERNRKWAATFRPDGWALTTPTRNIFLWRRQ